ncbi:unnamed protein product [Amoebophrya sp. A25]|nr:unnamed protein product [Amoebophrya sp. A25]|eukprot:GSA25T00001819001.1
MMLRMSETGTTSLLLDMHERDSSCGQDLHEHDISSSQRFGPRLRLSFENVAADWLTGYVDVDPSTGTSPYQECMMHYRCAEVNQSLPPLGIGYEPNYGTWFTVALRRACWVQDNDFASMLARRIIGLPEGSHKTPSAERNWNCNAYLLEPARRRIIQGGAVVPATARGGEDRAAASAATRTSKDQDVESTVEEKAQQTEVCQGHQHK